MARTGTWQEGSKILAAVVGTLPLAFGVGIASVFWLPVADGLRYAIGVHAVIPAWVLSMCVAFNARSARRAWLGVLGSLVVLGAAIAIELGSWSGP